MCGMVHEAPLNSSSFVRGSEDFGCQPQVSVQNQVDLGVAAGFHIVGLPLVNDKTSCFLESKGASRLRRRWPIALVRVLMHEYEKIQSRRG